MVAPVVIGNAGDLADGTMKAVSAGGREILLARAGERYFAAANRCPHLGGRLSEGRLKGTIVTCPRHGSQFDLSSGEVVRWLRGSGVISQIGSALKRPRPLPVYPVSRDGDRIVAEIPSAGEEG